MLFLLSIALMTLQISALNEPKHCEVCLKVMSDIHGLTKQLPNIKDKQAIETLIEKYCSKKNKKAGPRERKLCYYSLRFCSTYVRRAVF